MMVSLASSMPRSIGTPPTPFLDTVLNLKAFACSVTKFGKNWGDIKKAQWILSRKTNKTNKRGDPAWIIVVLFLLF